MFVSSSPSELYVVGWYRRFVSNCCACIGKNTDTSLGRLFLGICYGQCLFLPLPTAQ